MIILIAKHREEENVGQTCKWLLTSSLVRPSTFISSLIFLGVATAKKTHNSTDGNKDKILIQHSNY